MQTCVLCSGQNKPLVYRRSQSSSRHQSDSSLPQGQPSASHAISSSTTSSPSVLSPSVTRNNSNTTDVVTTTQPLPLDFSVASPNAEVSSVDNNSSVTSCTTVELTDSVLNKGSTNVTITLQTTDDSTGAKEQTEEETKISKVQVINSDVTHKLQTKENVTSTSMDLIPQISPESCIQIGEITYFTPPQQNVLSEQPHNDMSEERKSSDPILIPRSHNDDNLVSIGSVASVTSLLLANPDFSRFVDYSSGLFAEPDDDLSRIKNLAEIDTRTPPKLSWYFDSTEPVDFHSLSDDAKAESKKNVKITPRNNSSASETSGINSPFTLVTRPFTAAVSKLTSGITTTFDSKTPVVENAVKLDDKPHLFQNFTGMYSSFIYFC